MRQAWAIVFIIIILILTSRSTFNDMRLFSNAINNNNTIAEPTKTPEPKQERAVKTVEKVEKGEKLKAEEPKKETPKPVATTPVKPVAEKPKPVKKPVQKVADKPKPKVEPQKPKPVQIASDEEVSDYLENVERKIKAMWDPPELETNRRLAVDFTINKDGNVSNYIILESSGNLYFNDVAINTLKAQSYGPLPKGYDRLHTKYFFYGKPKTKFKPPKMQIQLNYTPDNRLQDITFGPRY